MQITASKRMPCRIVRQPVNDYERVERNKTIIRTASFILAFLLFGLPLFAEDNLVWMGNIVLDEFDLITGGDENNDAIRDLIALNFSNGENASIAGINLGWLVGDHGIAQQLSDICLGIAVSLIIAMFFISVLQSYLNGQLSDEMWLQRFASFGTALVLAFFAKDITMTVATVGSGLAEMIAEGRGLSAGTGTINVSDTMNQVLTWVFRTAVFVGIIMLFSGLVKIIRIMSGGGEADHHAFRQAISLTLGGIILITGRMIAGSLVSTSTSAVAAVSETTADSSSQIAQIRADLVDRLTAQTIGFNVLSDIGTNISEFFTALGYFFILLIPTAAAIIVRFSLYITCWGRAIEVLLLAGLSPLGVVGIDRGFDGPIRFIKQIFVLGIQGAVIMTIVIVCQNLQADIFADLTQGGVDGMLDGLSNYWSLLVVNLVEIGMLSRSRSIAQTLVG